MWHSCYTGENDQSLVANVGCSLYDMCCPNTIALVFLVTFFCISILLNYPGFLEYPG